MYARNDNYDNYDDNEIDSHSELNLHDEDQDDYDIAAEDRKSN